MDLPPVNGQSVRVEYAVSYAEVVPSQVVEGWVAMHVACLGRLSPLTQRYLVMFQRQADGRISVGGTLTIAGKAYQSARIVRAQPDHIRLCAAVDELFADLRGVVRMSPALTR